MENRAEPTWKPITAGILNIVSGGLQVFGVLAIIGMGVFFSSWVTDDFIPSADLPHVMPVIQVVFTIVLVIAIATTVIPIIGGVFALQRRHWGWALAGAILSVIGNLVLGILAIIFLSMCKEEFEQ